MDGLFSPNRSSFAMNKLINKRRREVRKVAPLAGIVESNNMPNAAYNMAPVMGESGHMHRSVNISPGFKPNTPKAPGNQFALPPPAGNRGSALHPIYAAAAAAAAASGHVSPLSNGKPHLNLGKLNTNKNKVNITTIRNVTKKKKCCTMLGGGGADDDDRPSLFVPATNATCSLPSNSSNKRRETRRRR